MTALSLLVLASLGLTQPQEPAQPEPVRLSGRVVDMRGVGVVAARVWIVHYAEPDKVLARTTTDGEGFFLIGKAPYRKSWQVWASAEGTCTAYQQTSPGRSVTVTVHDGVTVSGVLKDKQGAPIPNTLVRSSLSARVMFDTRCDAQTDASGRFTLAAVPLGYNRFSAWIDEIGLVELRRQVTGPCEIELIAGGTATTSMKIEIAGLPEANTEDIPITLLPYDKSLMYLPPPMRRPTTRGAWQCDWLPDWNYTVYLRSPNYLFEPNRFSLKPGTGPHTLQFTARAIATETIACHAKVSANGKPVAGVVLSLSRPSGADAVRATSNAKGELTWATPIPSRQQVRLSSASDDWVVTSSEGPIDQFLRNGKNRAGPTIQPGKTFQVVLERACEVTGQLQIADGRPAGSLAVKLEIRRQNHWPEWQYHDSSATKRDGSFRFGQLTATDGYLRLAVESAQGWVQSEPFELKEQGMRIKLPPIRLSAPAILEGVVRDSEQQPMPGVTVWLRDWDMARNQQRSGSVTEVITDKMGRYRFVGVPVGAAWLQLVPPGRHPSGRAVEPFEVASGKTYSRDLDGDGY